jgi:hypothetical protein
VVKKRPKVQKEQILFFRAVPTGMFVLVGLFYLLAPHEMHVGLGLDFKASHTDHLIFGSIFLIMAGLIWHLNGKRSK